MTVFKPLPIEELIHSKSILFKSKSSLLINEEPGRSSDDKQAPQADSEDEENEPRLAEPCGCHDHYSECLSKWTLTNWEDAHQNLFLNDMFKMVLEEMKCQGALITFGQTAYM